jgi:hypothetical protein
LKAFLHMQRFPRPRSAASSQVFGDKCPGAANDGVRLMERPRAPRPAFIFVSLRMGPSTTTILVREGTEDQSAVRLSR